MTFMTWYIEHQFLVNIIYLALLLIPSLTIYVHTKKIYQISSYKGIKYFRSAFLFYSISLLASLITIILVELTKINSFFIGTIIGEYGLIIGGFYLLYSLVWKQFKNTGHDDKHLIILHLITLFIGTLDLLLGVRYAMFTVQIVIFSIAMIVSFKNYMDNPKVSFLKYYFLTMILFFISWVLNFVAEFTVSISSQVSIYNLITNLLFFYLFMVGVILLAKK